MKTERQEIGKKGEDEACRFLQQQGHTIIERNWRGSRTELDIVSLAPDGLHFVEVKSRKAPVMVAPEANVTAAKMKHIVNAASCYLHGAGRGRFVGTEIFFDVVTVVFEGDHAIINYYPAAFRPMYF